MSPIWIFRHIACEGPGYLARFLDRIGLEYRIIAVDQKEPIPQSVNGASALVFMGGPMSVNDNEEWILQTLDLIRLAVKDNLPLLGHCLGGQLISKALGASVTQNPVREIGWHPVYKFENKHADAWLDEVEFPVELFHWHGETFALPEGVTPLLKSNYCQNQAYVKNNILALQCHIEMLPEMVIEWADTYPDQISEPSESVQSKQQMTEKLAKRINTAQRVADYLYKKWLIESKLI